MNPEPGQSGISTVYISIVTAVGAFSVSGLSIYLGYKLFLAGATGAFQFSLGSGQTKATLLSVAPGLGFAAFGMFIAVYALRKLVAPARSRRSV
jgi:hypothetical protein